LIFVFKAEIDWIGLDWIQMQGSYMSMYASLSVDKENANGTQSEASSAIDIHHRDDDDCPPRADADALSNSNDQHQHQYQHHSCENPDDTSLPVPVPVQEVSVSVRSKITAWNYIDLLVRNSNYRWYYVSHLLQNIGDWFVRIASVLVVLQLSSSEETATTKTGSSLAYLILSYMIPKTVFSQVGGVLSDSMDRRSLMIYLDLLSGVVVLGFLVAVHRQSLAWLYWITSLRSVLESIYYPITTGLVPLLVVSVASHQNSNLDLDDNNHNHDHNNDHDHSSDLQLATTLNTFAWSTMAMVGGILAGSASASVGWSACYGKATLKVLIYIGLMSISISTSI
jgi:hypothetical protein